MDKLFATQGLEREEDELRLREAELQRKKRLVEAKGELHKAEAAAEILCDGADPERMLALSSRGQKRTTEENIQHFLQSVKVEKHKETAPPTTRRRTLPKTPAPPPRARSISHDERPLPTLHTSTHGADPKNGAHERHDSSLNPNAPPWPPEDELVTSREDSSSSFSNRLLQVIEQQQQQQERLMTSIAMEMQLPKRDGITFDGNPLDFFPFCRYFETSVANKTLDNNVKRSHLINHCKGGALRAIKDCTAAPDDSGYDTAWKILKKKFGQPHLISQALLKRIIEGPANRAWDISSLSNLAIDMRNSELTLTHMNCETDMNSSETIDKIIVRLLTYIQQKWVSVSVRI